MWSLAAHFSVVDLNTTHVAGMVGLVGGNSDAAANLGEEVAMLEKVEVSRDHAPGRGRLLFLGCVVQY